MLDIVVQQTTIVEVKAPVLFYCPDPTCGRPITQRNRIPYPAIIAQSFAPVYHCRCGKHWGEPVEVNDNQT